jgi:lysozyme
MPQAPKGKTLATVTGGAAAALILTTVAMWEGKRNDPYQDIVGVWTVCYGETKVRMEHYTDEECRGMLDRSLVGYAEPVLKRNPSLQGHPHQLAAAVSLTYNIGPANYTRSTVAKRFSRGDWRGACDAFLMWSKAGGKVIRGLQRRREAERKLCLTDL